MERVRALAPNGIDAVFDVAGHGAVAASIELRGWQLAACVPFPDGTGESWKGCGWFVFKRQKG